MTEKRLKDLFVEFCYKVVKEDMENKRRNKEPAQPQSPVQTESKVNNNTNNNYPYQKVSNVNKSNNEVKATIIKCNSTTSSSSNNPMEVLTFETENGKKVNGYLTWVDKNQNLNFSNFFEPLGMMSCKTILKQENFDFPSLIGTKVIIETTQNEGYQPTVQKIKKVIKRPDTDEIPW